MGHFATHRLPNNNKIRFTAQLRHIMINITSAVVLVVVVFPFGVIARIMALITHHSNKATCYK